MVLASCSGSSTPDEEASPAEGAPSTDDPGTDSPQDDTEPPDPVSLAPLVSLVPPMISMDLGIGFTDLASTYASLGVDPSAGLDELIPASIEVSLGLDLARCMLRMEDAGGPASWGLGAEDIDQFVDYSIADSPVCILAGSFDVDRIEDTILAAGGQVVEYGDGRYWAVGDEGTPDFSQPEEAPWHSVTAVGLRAVVRPDLLLISDSDLGATSVLDVLGGGPAWIDAPSAAATVTTLDEAAAIGGRILGPGGNTSRANRAALAEGLGQPTVQYDYDPLEPYEFLALATGDVTGTATEVIGVLVFAEETAAVQSADRLEQTIATGTDPESGRPWADRHRDATVQASGAVVTMTAESEYPNLFSRVAFTPSPSVFDIP